MEAWFFKYQALGNDMVVLDPAAFPFPLTPATVRRICDRHFGLGADGICYGPLPDPKHLRRLAMRFFNPDGSGAEKSGNGLRIFARYLWDRGYVDAPRFEVWIGGEAVTAQIDDDAARTISMGIGRLSFRSEDIPVTGPAREVVEEAMTFGNITRPVTAVSAGNPHAVIFSGAVSEALVRELGPRIEADPRFPERTNVQLVQVLDRHAVRIEIWERGAGYTLASGTSASAAAGAAVKTGRCHSPVEVRMPGGAARVAIDAGWGVTLTGQVQAVCQGTFAADFVAEF